MAVVSVTELQFQPIVVSFVAISAVLCHCFKLPCCFPGYL